MSVGRQLHLVSYYFAPLGRADGVNRTYLAKYLAEAGWDIDVISCGNPGGFLSNTAYDDSLLEVLPGNVRIHRLHSRVSATIGDLLGLLRLIPCTKSGWYWSVRGRAAALTKPPGILLAVLPPRANGDLACWIARSRGLPYALYFVDDFLAPQVETVRNAAVVFAATDQIRCSLLKHYRLPESLVHVVRNGFAVEMQTQPKPVGGTLRIVFAGTINRSQSPECLAKAHRLVMQTDSELAAKIAVDFYGNEGWYANRFLRPHLSDHVRFHGYVPFAEAMREVAGADVAFASVTGDISFSSKVYQYINLGKPLLVVCNNADLRAFVESNGIGWTSPSGDVQRLAEVLREIYEQRERLPEIARNVLKLKPQMSLKAQAGKMSRLLEQCLQSGVAGHEA